MIIADHTDCVSELHGHVYSVMTACFTFLSVAGFLQGTDHMKPSFSIRYELGQGSASLGQDVVGLRQRLPVSRHLGVEVIAQLYI